MPRKNEGITKKEIIRTLLEMGTTTEPKLRSEIKKKLNLDDDSNIKLHLNELNKLNCITKQKAEAGKANSWIVSFDNLKYILEYFPEMDLKSNKNAVKLVCNHICADYCLYSTIENGSIKAKTVESTNSESGEFKCEFFSDILRRERIVHFLNLSSSFFKDIVTSDFEILKKRWYALFKLDCIKHRSEQGNIIYFEGIIENAFMHYLRTDIVKGMATAESIDHYMLELNILNTRPVMLESAENEIYYHKEIYKIKNDLGCQDVRNNLANSWYFLDDLGEKERKLASKE